MTDHLIPFTRLAESLGAGAPPPAGWLPLTATPLLILVGVTGVGKSTLLAEIEAAVPEHTLLPDRRDLTDRLIIAAIQQEDGLPPAPVKDRMQRFDYSRRYRQRYPGGMAHALAQLWLAPSIAPGLLIFDGLRGANEVTHAAALLPQAAFLFLDAPDRVRVRRLLGRNDAFDQVAAAPTPALATDAELSFAALGIPEAGRLFTPQEEASLLSLVRSGEVSAADLCAKLQIVVEERLSYDPADTRAVLLDAAPERTLVIDTVANTPAQAAQIALQWLPTALPSAGRG